MNIYENNGGGDPGGPLAPAEWTMSVRLEGVGDGAYYIADLRRARQDVCRLAMIGGTYTKEEARRALALKARLWIADYLTRPHSGSTEFGPL